MNSLVFNYIFLIYLIQLFTTSITLFEIRGILLKVEQFIRGLFYGLLHGTL